MRAVANVLFALSLTFASATPALADEGADEALEEGLEAAAGHESEPHSWQDVVFRVEFIAQVINFLILLWVLGRLLGGPLAAHLKSRRESLAASIDEAQRLRQSAERAFQEQAARMEQLDRELAKLREDMLRAGQAERDRMIRDAEAKAARLRRETEFFIEQQTKELRHQLLQEASARALEDARALLRTQSTEADQKRLAEGYLGQLREVLGKRRLSRAAGGPSSKEGSTGLKSSPALRGRSERSGAQSKGIMEGSR